MLLENGADVNARDNWGKTALRATAVEPALEAAKVLIEAGIDWDARNSDGKTTLKMADTARNNFEREPWPGCKEQFDDYLERLAAACTRLKSDR